MWTKHHPKINTGWKKFPKEIPFENYSQHLFQERFPQLGI
jgi:hypothetical protein